MSIPPAPTFTPLASSTILFGGATYPFPPLPDSSLIFSTQSFCRQTYRTCMTVFRDCLQVVGPIGNGSNQLCEAYRNDVCENGIRMGCDQLPPDRQLGMVEEGLITFDMPITAPSGGGGGGGGTITVGDGTRRGPGFKIPSMPMANPTPPPNPNLPLPTGTFVTTVTTSIPVTNTLGETTSWNTMSMTMTMSRDRRGLVFTANDGPRTRIGRKNRIIMAFALLASLLLSNVL